MKLIEVYLQRVLIVLILVGSVYDRIISKFNIEERKSFYIYLTVYFIGISTPILLKNMITFINKLINNKL